MRRDRFPKRLARFALAVCLCANANAQDTGSVGDGWLVDRWTSADGLPVNGVNAVHVDPSGYLWLATFDGLVRFDGHRFASFAADEAEGMPGHRLLRIEQTRDGLIWVLNDTGSLASFDGHAFRRYGIEDGLPPPSLYAMQIALDGAGELWAWGGSRAVRRVGGRFATALEDARLGTIRQVEAVGARTLWVAADDGVHRYEDGRRRRSFGAEHGLSLPALTLARDGAQGWWVGGQRNVVRLPREGAPIVVVADLGAQRIEAAETHAAMIAGFSDLDADVGGQVQRRERGPVFQATGRERLLARAADGSLWRNRLDALERDGTAVFASPCKINDFDFDAVGHVWVASACEGLIRLRPRRIEAITALDGVTLGSVYGLAQAPDGALWIATLDKGVARYAPGQPVRWIGRTDGNTAVGLHTLWIGADGETFIGSCRVDADGDCRTPPDWPRAAGRGDVVRALHRSRDGSFWVGGETLWQRTPEGQWRSAVAEAGLVGDEAGQVRAMLETADGAMWFGTRGRGLARRDANGAFRLFATADGLSSNAIRALREDRDGRVWIATEDRGLCRWSRDDRPAAVVKRPGWGIGDWQKQADAGFQESAPSTLQSGIPNPAPAIACLNRRHGLWSDSLHQVLFDAADRLWINSNHGIFAVERAALDAVLDGRARRVHPMVLTERDGLPSREGNGGVNDAGIALADGRLAFPTVNGVALFDPAQRQPSDVPALAMFEGYNLPDGQRLPARERIALPLGERSLTLHYTGLAAPLTAPVYFRYRLLPDERWEDLGDARQLNLSRLPPGEHLVELQAFGSRGAPGDTARMALSLPPYVHETTAFRIALPLLLFALLALWLLRQRRLVIARRRELERTVDTRTAELRGALETVNAQRNEIAQLAMSRTRFFANVSHELRTPLTLIAGPLRDAARGAPLTDATQRLMLTNAQRLERLVTQLLDLERIDAGRFPLRPEPGDLAALARETVEAFAPLARQRHIELSSDVGQAAAPLAFDGDQMARVLGNLLSNAMKFTPEGGRIAVRLECGETGCRISVSDTGPGVPEDWRERIFDRFAQVGSDATRSREGAGLGLAVCREIAHLHGGRLWVEENTGGGARFVLELPKETGMGWGEPKANPNVVANDGDVGVRIRSPQPVSMSDELRGFVLPPPGRRRVLVAEDHPDLRAYIAGVLRADHEVVEAEDGETGLQLAREQLPDLIVSDVMMPRRDGFSLARELRATPETAGIPLIFLTARASGEDEIEGLASGADQYLKKPFDAALLKAHVAAALHAVERLRRRFANAMTVESGIADEEVFADAALETASDETDSQTSEADTPIAGTPPEPGAEPTPCKPPAAADQRFLDAAQRWFDAHLHEETASVADMAVALHVSRATLARRYQKLTGETAIDALRRLRLARARELLAAGEGNVSEVAYAVGYASLASFSRAYREQFGHAPSQQY